MGYITELASVRVPTSLGELRAERVAIDDLNVSYRLSCPCGGTRGTVTSERATSEYDPSIYLWLDPYIFTCAECGRAATFFDSRRHGYDGVLNGGCACAQRSRDMLVTCGKCGGSMHEVAGDYGYSFAEDEIETEWTDEQRAQLPDLFDSVNFRLACAACGNQIGLGEFECA